MVLVHAGIADRTMWDPVWPWLSERGTAVRMDLRGFGASDTPADPVDHVADVLGVLDDAGLDGGHWVAASFGAGIAAEVAVTARDRVASLTLVAPGGSLLGAATEEFRRFVAAEEAALEAGDLDAAVAVDLDTWVVGHGRGRDDIAPDVLAQVARMQRRAFELEEVLGDVDSVELEPPVLERLDQILAPTLVLSGGRDLDVCRDAAQRVLAGVPGARGEQWPDVAHLPSLEQPERFRALLEEWLEEREGAVSR
ncbi:alpha/beta fold hydrolase [Nocardioides sambongensis]|uniref:alpha/beta fold hydrolase n=1 Tax=Nocardioides sambongensis TaxID=2589074 RepID=UPI0015E85C16|nr:alpha/beta hydrolase [Nocardioides sambongensis]